MRCPVASGKFLGEWRLPSLLGTQPLTALGSACGQDSPSTFGSHACTKAVVALAANVAGLKSAFHDRFLGQRLTQQCLPRGTAQCNCVPARLSRLVIDGSGGLVCVETLDSMLLPP